MKRAFVVFVLFVGYYSGLIVPSFASKFMDETTPSSQPTTIQIDLKNSNSIDEKELLQTGTEKENILNERAFIYINQQYRPKQRSQGYNSQRYSINKPFIINERSPQTNMISLNSIHTNLKPLKQFFIPNVKVKSALKTRYGPPNFKYQDREIKNKFNDDKYFLQKAVKQEIVSVKPVVLRLNKNADVKIDQETKNYSSEDIKQHYEKPLDMTSYPSYRINYNYGFPSPYSWHGSVDKNSDKTLMEDNMSAEGSLAIDNFGNLSPLDLNDADVLLDRYIKEALNSFESKEVLTNNEKMCKNCKEGKTDGLSDCKRHRKDTSKLIDTKHTQRSDENKHQNNHALHPALESRENERLFPYDSDRTKDYDLYTPQ